MKNNTNHQLLRIIKLPKKKKKKDDVPLKGYVTSSVISRFRAKYKKQHCWNIQLPITLKFYNITNM